MNSRLMRPRDWQHLFMLQGPLPFEKEFRRLQVAARHHPDCYNEPDITPPHQQELYDLALQANLINVAREMARSWGEDDSDGPLRGFDHLRCWPRADYRGEPALRLSYGVVRPKTIVDEVIGRREQIEIRDHNNRLVLNTEAGYIRPGDWINALMSEYARFRLWRIDREADPDLPKPVFPLPLRLTAKCA